MLCIPWRELKYAQRLVLLFLSATLCYQAAYIQDIVWQPGCLKLVRGTLLLLPVPPGATSQTNALPRLFMRSVRSVLFHARSQLFSLFSAHPNPFSSDPLFPQEERPGQPCADGDGGVCGGQVLPKQVGLQVHGRKCRQQGGQVAPSRTALRVGQLAKKEQQIDQTDICHGHHRRWS